MVFKQSGVLILLITVSGISIAHDFAQFSLWRPCTMSPLGRSLDISETIFNKR